MSLVQRINPEQTLVIGFGYKARHGKDTVVKSIIQYRGQAYDIRRYGFADAIKEELRGREKETAWKLGKPELLSEEPDMFDPLCPFGKHPKLLQFWGEYRRLEDPFYWVKRTASKIRHDNPRVALVPDVRKLYEVAWVKASSGVIVKVFRPGFVDPTRDPNHVSEIELDSYNNWDFVIENNSLDEVKQDALQVFDTVLSAYSAVPDVNFNVTSFGAEECTI